MCMFVSVYFRLYKVQDMLVYMPPTITYIYGLKKHYFLLISSTITIFQKVGISGISRTVKYLALCQILTHLIETSPLFPKLHNPESFILHVLECLVDP